MMLVLNLHVVWNGPLSQLHYTYRCIRHKEMTEFLVDSNTVRGHYIGAGNDWL